MVVTTEAFINMIKETVKNFYIFVLKNQFKKNVNEKDFLEFLELPEMKDFIDEIIFYENITEWIGFISNHPQLEDEREFFTNLGYNLDKDSSIGFGTLGLQALDAFILQFIVDYYYSLIENTESDFISKIKTWIDEDRLLTQVIYLASPINKEIDIPYSNELQFKIKITPYQNFRVADFSGPLKLEVFRELPTAHPDDRDIALATPSYPLKDDVLSYWENINLVFIPNVKITISLKCRAKDFHRNFDRLFKREEPNLFFDAFRVGKVFTILFNIMGLPSSIIEHTPFWDSLWDPLVPDYLFLFPKITDEEKRQLLKNTSFNNIRNKKSYHTQIDPRKVKFNNLLDLWIRYSGILFTINQHPSLNVACMQLNESFKTIEPIDILLRLMIGLEALFGTKRKISYNLAYNLSRLHPFELHNEKFDFIKTIYSLRSKIVHGDDYERVLREIYYKYNHINKYDDVIFEIRAILILSILDYMDILGNFPTSPEKYEEKNIIIKALKNINSEKNCLFIQFEENYNWLKSQIYLARSD